MSGLFIEVEGVSLTFCLGWSQTTIFLLSVSGVAGITEVSPHTWQSHIFPFLFLWRLLKVLSKITQGVYKYSTHRHIHRGLKKEKNDSINMRQGKFQGKGLNCVGMVVHICNPSTWDAEAGGSQVFLNNFISL
jgi:hypothetical protein